MLFKNPEPQAFFDENGYLICDLLDESQVEQLLRLYGQTVADDEKQETYSGLYESSRHVSLETSYEIMHGIRDVIEAPGARLFADGTLFGGTFLIKVPDADSLVPLHQDWAVVEEDRFQTAFIWCALQDIGPTEGCLFAIPGSHRHFTDIRSGSMPSVRIAPDGPLADLLVDLPLRKGQAIMWHDGLFHGSWPNLSGSPRLVCTGRINEQGSDLVYYHPVDDDNVACIKVTPRVYFEEIRRMVAGEEVEGTEVLKTFSHRYEPVTRDRFIARLVDVGALPAGAISEPDTESQSQ